MRTQAKNEYTTHVPRAVSEWAGDSQWAGKRCHVAETIRSNTINFQIACTNQTIILLKCLLCERWDYM